MEEPKKILELIKEEGLEATWWYIKLDGVTQKSTRDEYVARDYFSIFAQKLKDGLPKTKVIETIEI